MKKKAPVAKTIKESIKNVLIQMAIDDTLPMDMNGFDTSKLDEALKPLLEAIDLMNTVRKSCEEGYDGTWNSATNEGKEGFNDMITLLDEAEAKLR